MMISNSSKIYSKLCEVYPSALEPISSLSFNTDGNKHFVISEVLGFNYDKVYNFANCHPEGKKEKSPDCLFLAQDVLYFIEFKEGGAKKNDIRMKIHEGITTLFCFVIKYLPEITREEFLSLDIRYAVIMRNERDSGRAGFLQDLDALSNKFNLKNLEGFLVRKALIKDSPQRILDFLNLASSGKIVKIGFSSSSGITEYSV